MNKWLLVVLLFMLFSLQWKLWFGELSLAKKAELDVMLETKTRANQKLEERNRRIVNEVVGLKSGFTMIEEKAREDLGMVKHGETFYLVVDQQDSESADEFRSE